METIFSIQLLSFLSANKQKSFLFYPSSGRDENKFNWTNCPFDFVILCDKEAGKNSIVGKIISIKADNNFVLQLIYQAGIKLDCIVCKVCGAFEGGNYETCNSIMWLGRILPIMKNEFLYITNATGRMEYSKNYSEGPVKLLKNLDYPIWLDDIPNNRSRVKNLIVQKLAKTFHPEHTIEIGGTTITIQRKSIWQDVRGVLDGFFNPQRTQEAMKHFLPSYEKEKLRYIQDYTIGNSILPLLEEAERMKWNVIGLTPWANKNYNQFIKDLESWDGEYPKIIKLYHLEKKCFGMLYAFSSFIPKNDRCPDCNGNGCGECHGFGVLMDFDDVP